MLRDSEDGHEITSADITDLPEVVPAEVRGMLDLCYASDNSAWPTSADVQSISCRPSPEVSGEFVSVNGFQGPDAVAALREEEMFSEADIQVTPREGHGLRILDLSGGDMPTFFVVDIAPDGMPAAHYHLALPNEELPGLLGEMGLITADGVG